jgi:UDP-N-acetylglucosamine--N-acetylmuramyl-(pentapeptide) pyrophosphoryl-undecaprenol N-acetylglucosamine transferase
MRLLIAGGASGGHVCAALAVAQAFRARHPHGQVLLVGRRGGLEERLVPEAGFALETIHVRGLDRDARWTNVSLPWILPPAVERGLMTLDRFRPDVVLGVGAYAMVPCVAAARWRGVPYVLQVGEPDGLANRLFKHSAAAACVSFPADEPKFVTGRTVCTGFPVREGFAHRTPDAPARRLLIMGGGLGSRNLNQVVWQTLDDLLERFEELVHVTGSQGAGEAPRHARPRYRPIWTTADVAALMRDADLVVCRAGLGTCAELAAVGLPAILVPGTFGGAHQEHNAAELVRAGAATRIGDAELTAERLLGELDGLTPGRVREMARAATAMGRANAADLIVEVLEQTAGVVRAPADASAVVEARPGVEQLLGQPQPAKLVPHLGQDELAEVVGHMQGTAGRV